MLRATQPRQREAELEHVSLSAFLIVGQGGSLRQFEPFGLRVTDMEPELDLGVLRIVGRVLLADKVEHSDRRRWKAVSTAPAS